MESSSVSLYINQIISETLSSVIVQSNGSKGRIMGEAMEKK